MSIQTTDDMYNAPSREIEFKYEIFFTEGADPLVITKDNYLASSSGLEEAQSSSGDILGKVSSNEISFDLYNEDKLFTPNNTTSPYYKLIKKGVKVVAYGKVNVEGEEVDWDPLGTYYTTSWYTTSSGALATVTANDKLYSIFDSPIPLYKVTKNTSVKDLYDSFFSLLGVSAKIDPSISDTLPFAYINGTNKEFLSELSNGVLTFCFGNRENGVSIISRLKDVPLRATLTDDDQIYEVKDSQSIEAGYDGISVVTNTKQESISQEVMSIKGHMLSTGKTTLENIMLSAVPLIRLTYANVTGTNKAHVSHMIATPNSVNIEITNDADEEHLVDIAVGGTVIETVSSTYTEGGSNQITLNNNYIQTPTQLNKAVTYLRRANKSVSPMLEVKIRGNLKLQLGDKIHIQSTRYGVDYTGILIRHSYTYTGALSATITLLDATLLGEVT